MLLVLRRRLWRRCIHIKYFKFLKKFPPSNFYSHIVSMWRKSDYEIKRKIYIYVYELKKSYGSNCIITK